MQITEEIYWAWLRARSFCTNELYDHGGNSPSLPLPCLPSLLLLLTFLVSPLPDYDCAVERFENLTISNPSYKRLLVIRGNTARGRSGCQILSRLQTPYTCGPLIEYFLTAEEYYTKYNLSIYH